MTSFFIPDKIYCAFPFSSSFLAGGYPFISLFRELTFGSSLLNAYLLI